MKTNRRWVLAAALFLVLLTLALTAGREFLFGVLVQPITRLAWLIIRLFLSIHQAVYWTVLILAAVVVGVLMVPSLKSPPSLPRSYTSSNRIDRAAYWNDLLSSAADDSRRRAVLAYELERLCSLAGALADGTQPEEISLPPVGLHPIRRLRRMLGRMESSDAELNRAVDAILVQMETNLETDQYGKPFDANDK